MGKRKRRRNMKAILSLKKHHYLKTVSVFLIAAILIAGVVGCEGEGEPDTYNLTMAVTPAGGGTAVDVTGASPYAEATVVDIEAVPADCYQFVDWTAPAGTFGDANNATTAFTMPARDVTVTANFESVPPDHFKFYEVDWETAPYIGEVVGLEDQFITINNATVGAAVSFGNPVEKVHGDIATPIADLNRHYTLYELELTGQPQEPQGYRVTVNNQFQDDVELTVYGPFYLAVPTEKEGHAAPVCLNHFLVYEAYGPVVNDEVMLNDQFVSGEVAVVYEPYLFANPVQKTVPGSAPTPIEDPNEHWVLYDIWDAESPSADKRIGIDNQFGPQILDLLEREYLAVPSQKISWDQPLDHFKTYWAAGPPVDEVVELTDQFGTVTPTVGAPYFFANPTHKVTEEDEWTPISDYRNHLTFYELWDFDPQVYEVWVDNQFVNDPGLVVAGPLYLAVPSQKIPHQPPVDLDHFLVYEVLDFTVAPGEMSVLLVDQFTEQEVAVYEPAYFANPVQKIHGPDTTPIKNPTEHLAFYWISGGEYEDVRFVLNQFGGHEILVDQGFEDLLGVPSEKIEWTHLGPYMP